MDQIISIIVGSRLSNTLVNLSLWMSRIQKDKCLELGQMKKLKKIELSVCDEKKYPEGEGAEEIEKEVKNMLRKNLPNLTNVEDEKQENFSTPADPYAKHDASSGFWEISCNPLSCNF